MGFFVCGMMGRFKFMKTQFILLFVLFFIIISVALKGEKQDQIIIETNNVNIHKKGNIFFYRGAPFSGKMIEIYDSGIDQKKSSVEYKEGKKHGKYLSWYRGGTKDEQRFYKEGVKSGLHQGWWENGNNKFKYIFKNGRYHGLIEEWHGNSTIFIQKNYHNGLENGMQVSFRINGDLRYKYRALNGKQYGYIGTKLCTKPL